MIELINVSKKIDNQLIVDDITFSVNEGETFVLLGTSGCGKTTTLKMINRLLEPSSGKITIQDNDIKDENPEALRKKIGYVIQQVGLFPHYTVKENISMVPNLIGWDKQKIKDRVYELMNLFGLEPEKYINRYPFELSGGQKQRVGIARALAADPPIILLDEPFGALDPITKRQIQKEFKKIELLLKKTIILITHDISEAFELGNKICLMNKGKIKQIGNPQELIFNPQNTFVQSFFESEKFQLELMVIKLKDIIPLLPQSTAGTTIEIDSDINILSCLDLMGKTKNSSAKIIDKNKTVLAKASSQEILSAFFRRKESSHK